jgi:HEAT repeat protein
MTRNANLEELRIDKSWRPFMKLRAINSICELRTKEAVSDLMDLLRNDPNPIVRHESAFALGEMGFPEALPALKESLLSDPDSIVRHEAAFALGLTKLKEALEILRTTPDDVDIVVRQTVEIAIDNLTFDLGLQADDSQPML